MLNKKLAVVLLPLLLNGCYVADHFKNIFVDERQTMQLQSGLPPMLSDLKGNIIHNILENDVLAAPSIALSNATVVDGDGLTADVAKRDLAAYSLITENYFTGGSTLRINIRYLITDAPESKHRNKPVQPYSKEAAARNAALLQNAQLTLTFGKGDKMDDYGRLLGYVYADGVLVQEVLIREGYARVAYVSEQNTSELARLRAAEELAKSEKLRIWSIPNYVTDYGFSE